MKLRIISLLVLALFSACGKTEAQRLEGKYESQLEMKLFDPAQIPNLLSYANDEREVHPPANPLSSYLSVSSLGIYALWMIEGIRLAEGENDKAKVFMGYPSLNPLLFDEQTSGRVYYGTEAYPATQRKAADAYRAWWNSGEFSNIKAKNPLDGSSVRRDHHNGPWGEGLARDGELPADSGLQSADVVLAVREGEIC